MITGCWPSLIVLVSRRIGRLAYTSFNNYLTKFTFLFVENSTTEDTSHTSSLLMNCQSRLGQDLLRMFMEEIAPDVIVEVSGRRIKAHKCILSSR